jgi:arylsulfatase A-like enzyme
VLDELERLGLASNTIVVLFCDHGYSLGEADHCCKDTNFEIDTHVPLHRLRWRRIFLMALLWSMPGNRPEPTLAMWPSQLAGVLERQNQTPP